MNLSKFLIVIILLFFIALNSLNGDVLMQKCYCPYGYTHRFEPKGWWWNPNIEVCLANKESTATKLPKFDCFYPPYTCIYRDFQRD